MTLAEFADRRARLAGWSILERVRHFMGSLDQVPRASGRTSIVSFGNYDYLGLAQDPSVRQAASDAVIRFGAGVSASRMIGGERDFHGAFEDELADFLGVEATLTLVSGYLTNVSILGHVLGTRDLVLSDELSHNSIVAGIAGSRARSVMFRHNDIDHLEELLRATRRQHARCLIVVEGLYSMDGDVPDLPRLIRLKEEHDAWLMVDEAHSIGVAGATGRGISEHFGTDPQSIDLLIGTLSKAFGSCGGFVAADRRVIDWLHYSLPGFVFSVGTSPATSAASRAALTTLRNQPWRVEALQENSRFFRDEARAHGLQVGEALGLGVVPVLFPDNPATVEAAEALLEAGFYCPPIIQVGVPRNRPRLRFFLSALHEKRTIVEAIEIVARVGDHATAQAAVGQTTLEAAI